MKEKGSSFSGSIGFVLAAAGSAVGVGNIWRFPYLCAKDGGGLFLLIYLVLVLTFGFVLLTTDVAIGRKTKKNALRAFEALDPKWKFLGRLTFLVPTLIMTYYSVIGGWIVKYFFIYLVSDGTEAAADGYFTSFITSDADFPCTHCMDRIPRCRKRNRKVFQHHHAGADPFNRGHCDLLPDLVPYRCRWYRPYRYAGPLYLFKAGLSWIDHKTLFRDPSGRDEPVILFLKRIHGNHDHLRLLCKK